VTRLGLIAVAAAALAGCSVSDAVVGERQRATRTTTTTTTTSTVTEGQPGAMPLRLRAWRDRSQGVGVGVPPGWSIKPGRFLPYPTVCFELVSSPRAGPPGVTSRPVPADGVEIRLVEFVGVGRGPTTRPERLRLADARPAEGAGWTEGRILAFRERNRAVAIGVLLGPDVDESTAQAAEAVVNSIRIESLGRCGREEMRWRKSRALGLPWAGQLVNGVQLPAAGRYFFTWDPILHRSPDRPGRRWGTDGVVRKTLRIVEAFARAHPGAARVAIGDFSRRRGGDFGPRHVSHQNGLDVDVYYPRLDGRERPPRSAAQVDRRLAQDLVDRFVAAGAVKVFVGPSLGLRGPRGIVQVLANHDNHLHARFPKRLG
jgi:hypothetical protein